MFPSVSEDSVADKTVFARKKCSKMSCKTAGRLKQDLRKQRINAVNIDHTPVAQLDRAADS